MKKTKRFDKLNKRQKKIEWTNEKIDKQKRCWMKEQKNKTKRKKE